MRMQFKMLADALTEAWIGGKTAFADFKSIVMKHRFPALLSGVVELGSDDPYDFVFDYVVALQSKAVDAEIRDLQYRVKLRDFPDRGYVDTILIPRFVDVMNRKHPRIETIRCDFMGRKVVYDCLTFPEPCEGKPAWLLTASDTRRFMQSSKGVGMDDLDDTDFDILHLLSAGQSAKEISRELNISPRTIEHRIAKAKDFYKARNTPHLVALYLADGF